MSGVGPAIRATQLATQVHNTKTGHNTPRGIAAKQGQQDQPSQSPTWAFCLTKF